MSNKPKVVIVEEEPASVEQTEVSAPAPVDFSALIVPLENIFDLTFTDGREFFKMDAGRVSGDYILRSAG